MGTKHKHLYEKIYNIDNLRNAYKKAARGGNRYTIGNLKFQEDLEANLYALQQTLINETYAHGRIASLKSMNRKSESSMRCRLRIVSYSTLSTTS